MLRIHDFNVMVKRDVTRRDRARALLAQGQVRALAVVHKNRYTLEVEEDIDDIFLYPFQGGVLMQYAVDRGFRNGTTDHGRKQNTTQRITQGVTEATLQRLKSHFCTCITDLLNTNHTWLK